MSFYPTILNTKDVSSADYKTRAGVHPGCPASDLKPWVYVYQTGQQMMETTVNFHMNPDDLRLLADELEKAITAWQQEHDIRAAVTAAGAA